METSALLPRPRHTRARWGCLPLLHHLTGALLPPPRRKMRLVRLHVPNLTNQSDPCIPQRRKWCWSRCTERRRRRRKAPPRLLLSTLATYLMPDLSHLDGILTFSFWMPFIIKHSQNVSKVWKHAILSLLLYAPKSFDRPYSA